MSSAGVPLVPASYCTGCGHPFDDDDRFCATCGSVRKDVLRTTGRSVPVGAPPSHTSAPIGRGTRRPSAPASAPTGAPAGAAGTLDQASGATMSASSRASSGKDGPIAWARSLMGRTDWVILDTETTGLGSTDVVIQIGVTDHRGVTLVDTLVRPAVAIGSGAQAVHGISAEAVAGARDFPTVLPELVRAVAGKTVVAYNAPFDRRLLDQTAFRHGVTLPEVRWDCAMQWYTRFLGVRSAKLPGATHGATGDCLATLAVIRTMAGPAVGEAVRPAATAALATPAAHVVILPPAPVDPRKWTVVAGKAGGGWGARGSGAGEFIFPHGIALDGNGAVWVADLGNHRIQVRDPDGRWRIAAGNGRSGNYPGEFDGPYGIAVGADGAVWVTESGNHRIQRYGVR